MIYSHNASAKHSNNRHLLCKWYLHRPHHQDREPDNSEICDDIDRAKGNSKGILVDAALRPPGPRVWKTALEGKAEHAGNHPGRSDAEKAIASVCDCLVASRLDRDNEEDDRGFCERKRRNSDDT